MLSKDNHVLQPEVSAQLTLGYSNNDNIFNCISQCIQDPDSNLSMI